MGRSVSKLSIPSAKPRLISDYVDEVMQEPVSPGHKSVIPKQHPGQECQTPGLVTSVWGCASTDEDKFIPNFTHKKIHFDGEVSKMSHRVGVRSQRGSKPEQPNQDDFFVLSRQESMLLGVFDGHGEDGHVVSHCAQELLPQYITERLRKDPTSWEESVRASVEQLTKLLGDTLADKSERSGSTMTLALLDHPPPPADGERSEAAEGSIVRLRVAFLGDSIAILGTRPIGGSWDVHQLTNIHRPDRSDEAERITSIGGPDALQEQGDGVARLCTPEGRMANSRSLGDFHAVPYGLSSDPEFVPSLELEDGHMEHLLLVCSDGIWDVMTPMQAIQVVGKFNPEQAQLAAERLIGKAQLKWREIQDAVDDITAIVVWPQFGKVGKAVASPLNKEAGGAEAA